jgi:hypothetical protein
MGNGFAFNMVACKQCGTTICWQCKDNIYKALSVEERYNYDVTPGDPCKGCETPTTMLYYNDDRGYAREFTATELRAFVKKRAVGLKTVVIKRTKTTEIVK